VIGALIGGIGSFSGAYLTYQQQRDTHAADVKRAAYLSLMTKSREYEAGVGRMRVAASNGDETAYAKEREKLQSSTSQSLYAAMANVYLVTDDNSVKDTANATGAAYFFFVNFPASIEKFDDKVAEKVQTGGSRARDTFSQAARNDVLRD
jgi:hypothetical protein